MRYCQLLVRDLFRRVAEYVGVLERHVREQDDRSVDNVGGVEPSPETSNCVAPRASACGRILATASSKSASTPSIQMRSGHPLTCGEVYAPARLPSACKRAAIVRVAVDLPFVPTT
jgi:hypothetical protein